MNKRPSSGKKDSFKSSRDKGGATGGKREKAPGRDKPFAKRSDDKKPFDRSARDRKDDTKPGGRPKYNAEGSGDKPYSKRSDDRNERPSRDKGDDTRSFKPRGEATGDRPYAKREEGKRSSERPGRFKKDDGKTYKPNTFESEKGTPRYKDDKRVFDQPKREDGRLGKKTASGDKPFTKRGDDRKTFDKTGRIKKEEPRTYKPNTFESNSDQDFENHPDAKKPADRPVREKKEDSRPFRERNDSTGERPYAKRNDDRKDGDRPFAKRSDDKKPYGKVAGAKSDRTEGSGDRKAGKKPFEKKTEGRIVKKTYGPQGSYGDDKPDRNRKEGSFARSIDYKNRPDRPDMPVPDGPKMPKAKREKDSEPIEIEKEKTAFKTPHKHKAADKVAAPRPEYVEGVTPGGKTKRKRKHADDDDEEDDDAGADKQMTLNKYIAHSGECGRREAAELVKQGKVKVNGELVMDPGYRVQDTDMITLVGKKLQPIKDFAYVLLNKPKGFITTTEDPQERKTVMDLVDNSGVDRLYPVGRLDRNTSGLLLLTNDGDLAQKLSHPGYAIKKVYQVTLDKSLTKADFEKVAAGVTLDDGIAIVDEVAYLESKNEIGLEIHSGRNRIVRRIFESMGYVVEKLDRVMYAGLTKKNLPRGKWRFLTDQEIIRIKHFKS
ncbi:MAG: pseudouridine synthase [Flavipsychrobacter sp.]|nr:pseudouridine synthase [Flavipsychrobacter sp.]